MQNTAVILLAAGGSTRMKSPKLAKTVGETTLLNRAIGELNKFNVALKVVVFGRDYHLYSKLMQNKKPFEVVINDEWDSGISSSIKCGINSVQGKMKDSVENYLITLADMPLVTANYLQDLLQMKSRTGKGIVASNYGKTLGPPVVFDRKYTKALLSLVGDQGAKNIIGSNRNDLSQLSFPEGLVDIDTSEDLERFRTSISK